MRARLAARGSGKWLDSTGDRSKFGLSASELMKTVDLLRDADLLDCREASSAARRRPDVTDPLDAAYRAFLGCMERRGWQRGAPPP